VKSDSQGHQDQRLFNQVRSIKSRYEGELLGKPNVVGIGVGMKIKEEQGTQEMALIVMVSRKVPASELAPEDRIPSEVEGVPVDVREVGEFEAYLE
jgi:hypothetical protein